MPWTIGDAHANTLNTRNSVLINGENVVSELDALDVSMQGVLNRITIGEDHVTIKVGTGELEVSDGRVECKSELYLPVGIKFGDGSVQLTTAPVFLKAMLNSQQIPQQTGFAAATGNGRVIGMTESFNSMATGAWSSTANEFTTPTKGFWNIRFALELASVDNDTLQSCLIKIKLTPAATGQTSTYIAQGGLNMGANVTARNNVAEWFLNCNTIELLQQSDKISFHVYWVETGTSGININHHGTHCDFLLLKEVP